MSQGIVHNRVSRFLEDILPFSYLDGESLLQLASQSQVQFYDKGEIVFEEGGAPPLHFYVIQQGSVELLYRDNGKDILTDVCEAGDIFGIKALIGQRNYINTSKTKEETLLLVVPYSEFEPHIDRDPKIAMYFAAGFSSGRSSINISKMEAARRSLTASGKDSKHSLSGQADSLLVHRDREVIYCSQETSILEASRIMSRKNVGSILVLDIEDRPIGIITDVDFRKKVVAEEIPGSDPVSRIMSSPVATVKKDITLAETIITMMQKNIRHLCITLDGTDNSRVEGIVTEHDIMLLQGNTPAVITKEMLSSTSTSELKNLRDKAEDLLREYVSQELSMSFIFDMITHVNDILIKRIIELKIAELEAEGRNPPPLKFAWLSLGSEGRREQALRTDQDNAIVYEEPPQESADMAKNYFLDLGKKVVTGLNECGFSYCKGEVMANKWCYSLPEWKSLFSNWIDSPTPRAIMHFSIFFDFRIVYGDASLGGELDDWIENSIQGNPNSLRWLAVNAISASPPIGFFRGLSVESKGEHKDHFDIKAKGTVPIVDAARVLALENKIRNRSTMGRWKALSSIDPDRKKEYEDLIITFEMLSRIRLKNSLHNPDQGNFVNPKSLHKIEKESMKYSFQFIQDLQKKLEVHFRLDLIPR